MIDSFGKAFRFLLEKPAVFFAPFIAWIVGAVVLFFVEERMLLGMLDIVFSQPPITDFTVAPLQFVLGYPLQVGLLFIVGLFLFGVELWALFAVVNFLKEKKSISASVGFAFNRIPQIILLLVFFLIVFLALGVMLWIGILIMAFNDIIGIICSVVLLLIILYVLLRIAFVPTAMAFEKLNLKEGIKKAASFSNKRLLSIIVFFAILSVINVIIGYSSLYLYANYLLSRDFAAIALSAIATIILASFNFSAMGSYYAKASK